MKREETASAVYLSSDIEKCVQQGIQYCCKCIDKHGEHGIMMQSIQNRDGRIIGAEYAADRRKRMYNWLLVYS